MTHNKYHGSGRRYTEMELDEREDALAKIHPRNTEYKPRITPGILDKLLARAKRMFRRGRV